MSSAALSSAGPGTVLMRSAGSATCVLRKWPHRADAGRRGGVQPRGTRGMDLGARLLRGRHTLPENRPVGRLHLRSPEPTLPWSPGLSIRLPITRGGGAARGRLPGRVCVERRSERLERACGAGGASPASKRGACQTLRLSPPRAAPVPCLLCGPPTRLGLLGLSAPAPHPGSTSRHHRAPPTPVRTDPPPPVCA